MKLKYKIFLGIFLLFIIAIIIVLGLNLNVNQSKKKIYDDNIQIAQEGDSYTFRSRIGGGESIDKIDINYSGFYGTDTIWKLESIENGEVTLNYDSIVHRGDFKVVLVSPTKDVENILVGTKKGSKTIKLEVGKTVIKLVGRNARGEINISIDGNQYVGIAKNKR